MPETPPISNPSDLEMEKLKIHSESKPLEFSDLTTDVLRVIIENSELKERLILRKVSRGLRALVDQQKSIWRRIGFQFNKDHICANYNQNRVIYAFPRFDCRKYNYRSPYFRAEVIKSENYFRIALDDLKFATEDPNVQLVLLNVEFFSSKGIHWERFSEELETILKSANHQVSVKTFEIRAKYADHILSILPYLKPSTLSRIELRPRGASWKISDEEFDKIAELEQWKQAKKLGLNFKSRMWPEKHLMHFEEFTIFDWSLDVEEIRRWRDIFSRSKNFIAGRVVTKDGFYPYEIQNHISQEVPTLMTDKFSNTIYVIEHPILDDSNQYLEIKVHPVLNCIVFKKLSRQSS